MIGSDCQLSDQPTPRYSIYIVSTNQKKQQQDKNNNKTRQKKIGRNRGIPKTQLGFSPEKKEKAGAELCQAQAKLDN